MTTKTIHGTVRGRTIELDEDLGVTERQKVELQVTVVEPPRKWGDGLCRSAGALADDPHWDAIPPQNRKSMR
jgi:hypothetical protein